MINTSDTETTPENLFNNSANSDDGYFELSLRPQSLSQFIGQQQLKDNLNIVIGAAKLRNEPLDHLLLYGPPGLGKTTLAHIISKELGSNIKTTSGPAIERAGDLASLLTNLNEGDVLFIDEIHRLNKVIEEILYPAMEDRVLDIMIGKGPGARSVRMELPRFTLIGATTRVGLISAPMRDRFGIVYHLDYYSPEDLSQIVSRSADILKTPIDSAAVDLISQRSRYTPRIANRLLKRVRDFSQVSGHDKINPEHAENSLKMLDIDEYGLDKHDRRILEIIIKQFNGGPVGVNSIAAATGEESDTISDMHEPFLIRSGFLIRTPKGRQATKQAYDLFDLEMPSEKNTPANQSSIF
ncbi:Holliday junction branch migration DNA helicase RuvB [bacterium]|nr:MAG: Holliday junction branch migration DNA helicase RuvB [bacterium]